MHSVAVYPRLQCTGIKGVFTCACALANDVQYAVGADATVVTRRADSQHH
jgi:hypothetical protein